MRSTTSKCLTVLSLSAACWFAAGLGAQPANQTLYTVGTSHEYGNGEHAAYVLWEASERELMNGLAFEIYHKPGGPDSAAAYARVGAASYQTDGYTLAGILDRARYAGEDPSLLEERIDNLFGSEATATGLPLREKLANVMLVARDDDAIYQNLVLLSRVHPGVAMAMGKAWVLPAEEGEQTFEIRQLGSGGATVVGRVTVDVGRPRVLPPPDTPHALTDTSARGNLNARLIWGTPDPLRRLGLLHYGYSVYRIDRDFAEAQGFDQAPPEPELARVLAANDERVVQVNNLPVVTGDPMYDSDAAAIAMDPEETDTFFIGDDNGAYHGGDQFPGGGEPFVAGSEYYYYVAALDVLGRPGELSEGRPVIICDRIPPQAPVNVRVENTFTYEQRDGDVEPQRYHALKVSWDPPEGEDVEDIDNYYIYRFESVEEIHPATAADYETSGQRVGGPVHHMAGLSFVDDGISDPSHYGRTFYYTVRSSDEETGCGLSLSGHSAPASGVLRDREGPEAPTVELTIQGGELFLELDPQRIQAIHLEEAVPGASLVRFVCVRQNRQVEWAEFALDGEAVGRVSFGESDTVALLVPYRGSALRDGGSLLVGCTVGAPGFEPAEVESTLDFRELQEQEALEVPFQASARVSEVPLSVATVPHQPVDYATGDTNCIDLSIALQPGTREYKVYRRIDGGRLVLVEQGIQDADEDPTVTVNSCSMAAAGGESCFFVQAFDENGNASAMSEAACTAVLPSQELPVPMLAAVEPVVTQDGDAHARLSWFCSPNGVERFEVLVTPQDSIPGQADSDVSEVLGKVIVAEHDDREFAVVQTGRVGGDLASDGGAGFTADIALREGVTYSFTVRAVGEGAYGSRAASDYSNLEKFYWSGEDDGELLPEEVPWPQREPPEADSPPEGLQPRLLEESTDLLVGIPVGEFSLRDGQNQPVQFTEYEAPFPIPRENPAGFLTSAGNVFPCVVYRYEVGEPSEPQALSDIVQVTPLLEGIAFEEAPERDQYPDFPEETPHEINVVHDPFFLAADIAEHSTTATHQLYIRDTHPATDGARYRYLLVRFTSTGEIDRIIPTPPIEIHHPEFSNF